MSKKNKISQPNDAPLTQPQNRLERFLAEIANLANTAPDDTRTRLERYLAAIVQSTAAAGTISADTNTTLSGILFGNSTTGKVEGVASDMSAQDIADYLEAVAGAVSAGGIVNFGQLKSRYSPPLYQYDGEDLTVKFADEIAQYSDFGAWLQARLAAKNSSGIFVKDYFKFNTSNNVTFTARIADINHDLGYGDIEVTKWHIDFICDELWPDNHIWNPADYNNGISTEQSSWLCSDLYHFLNSLSGSVPNDIGADPATIAVDYTSAGVFDKFPAWLRDAIVERRSLEPTRYTAGTLLTNDNSWAWKSIGKLWVPSEVEYYGFVVWSTRGGYSIGEDHMYPLMRDSKMRIKRKPDGNRYALWLRRTGSGNSTRATVCTNRGNAGSELCTYASVALPVCFRIMAN